MVGKADHLELGMISALPRVVLGVVELLAVAGKGDSAHGERATLCQETGSENLRYVGWAWLTQIGILAIPKVRFGLNDRTQESCSAQQEDGKTSAHGVWFLRLAYRER